MRVLAYFAVLAVSAATLAVSVELITRPDHESTKQVAVAPGNVRQIPINRTTDAAKTTEADRGDPNNTLSPVYPAAPRQDLMPKTAETTGSAPKEADSAPAVAQPNATTPPMTTPSTAAVGTAAAIAMAPATTTNTSVANNSAGGISAGGTCAVDACSSAYRSFRASDCTYQPMSGERKVCSLSSSGAQQAAAPTMSTTVSRGAGQQLRSVSRANDLDEVERVVRRLPAYDDDDEDDRRVIYIERERRPSFGFGFFR